MKSVQTFGVSLKKDAIFESEKGFVNEHRDSCTKRIS